MAKVRSFYSSGHDGEEDFFRSSGTRTTMTATHLTASSTCAPIGQPIGTLWASDKTMPHTWIANILSDEDEVPRPSQVLSSLQSVGIKPAKKDGITKAGRATLATIQELAQGLLDIVLLDAPRLSLSVGTPRDWILGTGPAWLATTHAMPGLPLAIDALSRAERRWATLAIALATSACLDEARSRHWSLPEAPRLIILDEPETALHRSAEAFMADGLLKWAAQLNAHVIVASHSPELLDLPSANVLSVMREPNGGSLVKPLVPAKETMARFGLLPSDLLRRQRVFLLVEGAHDEIVIEGLIGEDLRNLWVDILPLRGASQLPATVDSQFLFDFTDAHIIALVDALDATRVAEVWESARALAQKEGSETAGQHLRDSLPGNAPELRWMRESSRRRWLVALRIGSRRLAYQSLHIVEYLPCGALVPRAASWVDLRSDHQASGSRKDFKSWLRAAKGASFSSEDIRRAVGNGLRSPGVCIAYRPLRRARSDQSDVGSVSHASEFQLVGGCRPASSATRWRSRLRRARPQHEISDFPSRVARHTHE